MAKVTGTFEYASDLRCEGMAFGATLRAMTAPATIARLDLSLARAVPGVLSAMCAADLPAKTRFGLNFDDQPVLAEDTVRYAGEPVAIVAATSANAAREAVDRIQLVLEPTPGVYDMETALHDDAPKVHDFGNVLRHVHILHGDPAGAAAEVWVEGYYETAMQDQAPLGPEAGLAIPAADGGIDLHVATQWLHVDREQIAPCLGLPDDKLRVHLAGVGGAFGSREDLHMQIHACLLAQRTGRPVKIEYGREESFHGHVHRHPARIWMRHGADREGRLDTITARLLFDGGAYASSSPAVLGNAASFAAGPYEVPNVLVEATVVYTNNPPCGAMRGFGAPQVCFAHEAQMDKLAVALGQDPVELRLQNALHTGSVLPIGQVLTGSAPVREVIEACAAIPLPAAEGDDHDGRHRPGGCGSSTRGEGVKRGVGLAVGYKNVAFSEGFDDGATARVTLGRRDGEVRAEIHTAAVEVGQGLHTILAQIVRSELGVETVEMRPADTLVGDAGSSSASRQSTMAGGAVQQACAEVRGQLFERAGVPRSSAEHCLADGWLWAEGHRLVRLEDLLDEPISQTAVYHHRRTGGFDESGQGDVHVYFSFAAERAVVDVDDELGLVRVVQIAAAVDAGRVMNPLGFTGQVEGGTAQGVGLALTEELRLRDGVVRNASFTDYLIPTCMDMPPVATAPVEVPEPSTPYGLKGIGESPTIVATAAVVAAIRDATGRELNQAPARADQIAGLRGPAVGSPPPPVPEVPGQLPVPYYLAMGAGQQRLM